MPALITTAVRVLFTLLRWITHMCVGEEEVFVVCFFGICICWLSMHVKHTMTMVLVRGELI